VRSSSARCCLYGTWDTRPSDRPHPALNADRVFGHRRVMRRADRIPKAGGPPRVARALMAEIDQLARAKHVVAHRVACKQNAKEKHVVALTP
jgi:hypothetical protein